MGKLNHEREYELMRQFSNYHIFHENWSANIFLKYPQSIFSCYVWMKLLSVCTPNPVTYIVMANSRLSKGWDIIFVTIWSIRFSIFRTSMSIILCPPTIIAIRWARWRIIKTNIVETSTIMRNKVVLRV